MQIFTHLTANDVQLQAFPFKRELSMEAYLIENEGILALDRDIFSDVEIVEAGLTLLLLRQIQEYWQKFLHRHSPSYEPNHKCHKVLP